MTPSTAHGFLHAFLRPVAILAIVVAHGVLPSLPARGQVMRPAVHIAYVHNGNVWILDGPTGRRTQLTADGHDSAPRWTSDGRALLFERQTGGAFHTLRWQPGKGHPQAGTRRLRDGLWSPDGLAVAFVRVARQAGSATTVWIARQGQTVRVTPIQRGFRWYPAAWSADSGRLALTRFAIPPPTKPGQEIPPASASLWVTVGAPGAAPLRRLPLPLLSPGHPGWPDIVFWSPNGRFLTVGVGPDMQCESCRADGRPYDAIPVAGGTVVHLGTALGPDVSISWAPDGSFVVLSSPAGRETYWDKYLFRVDPTTAMRRTLSHNWRWADIEPAVSPDGKHVAFARGRALGPPTRLTPVELIASRHLFLMDSDGAQSHQLTNAHGWTDEAPVWSPGGQWLFFVRWRRHYQGKAAEVALWAVRVDGTDPQRIARLNVPGGFLNGFGYYGSFGWRGLFDVAP